MYRPSANAANTSANTRHASGRRARAGDIARAVAFLASDSGAYITGQTLVVDGGMTM